MTKKDKATVALDNDEVVNNHMIQMCLFHGNEYDEWYSPKDFKNYQFHETWNITEEEGTNRYYEFRGGEFGKNMKPLPGSQEVIKFIKENGIDIVIVSAAQNEFYKQTEEFYDKYFPGIVSDIFFGNHYAKNDDPVYSKIELIKQINNPTHFFDDQPKNVIEVANAFPEILSYIFSPNEYSWAKQHNGLPYNAGIVKNWQEIEKVIIKDFQLQ